MPGSLPPLPPKDIIVPKGMMERKVSAFDDLLVRAALHPKPWWKAIALGTVHFLARCTLNFAYTYPYFFRPWRWAAICISKLIRRNRALDARETPKRLFFERLFHVYPVRSKKFHSFFAVLNWIFVWFCITLIPVGLEGMYAYGTITTYDDVIVTQSYRQITKTNTFAVHGYQLEANGGKSELYFEIGPNLWHWDLFPEFLFGQISNYDRCTFKTYGWSIRIPKAIRVLSEDGIYILNPWIIAQNCVPPTIIPKQKD